MTRVEEIQSAIESLSGEDYARLKKWLSDREWEEWDAHLQEDSEHGTLDFLTEEAISEKANRKLRDF
ncbi:MAG: hypothetical protein WC975_15470 [Phycisphaerae bacterium]